jgi:ribonucleoside-diphosphate reductase alpha chain
MPNSASPQDVADAYMLGWELGLKALAVYRDGSKGAQPLNTSNKGEGKESGAGQKLSPKERRKLAGPRREHLPDTRRSVTHKFNVAGHEGYITVGLYPDGRVGEMFIVMAKEGSTIGGLMDCFGTAISMSLQYGVPLNVYIEKFSHTRFEPLGQTKNPDIPHACSLVDYIFRWLETTFLPNTNAKKSIYEGFEYPELERPVERRKGPSNKENAEPASANTAESAKQKTLDKQSLASTV